MDNATVLISEVGPRDGLQSVKATMPTADKLAWIDHLYQAGLREIEVCSFVPAKHLPQMADAAEVVRHATALPGLTVMALVPNWRGAEAALAAGVHKLTVPVSASEAHSLANVRKSRVDMVEEVRSIVALKNERAPHVQVEAGVSTAFGCTIQGAVADNDVVWLAGALVEAGVNEVGLSDTTGMANCLAAFDVGVTTFDSSQGGLGGCPYAPGASGNVVTEDLVFMFEAMGVDTGVSWDTLCAARVHLQRGLPQEPLYGMTPEAGWPLGWTRGS